MFADYECSIVSLPLCFNRHITGGISALAMALKPYVARTHLLSRLNNWQARQNLLLLLSKQTPIISDLYFSVYYGGITIIIANIC